MYDITVPDEQSDHDLSMAESLSRDLKTLTNQITKIHLQFRMNVMTVTS